MTRSIILAACALLISFPAAAGPLDTNSVPARAQVVVHVDLDALRGSQLRRIFDKQVSEAMADMQGKLVEEGIPLQAKDIANATGITFWAEGDSQEHGALIASGLDPRRVSKALATIKGHRRISHKGQTLHEINQDGDTTYVGVYSNQVAVADDKDSIAETLQVLAGRGSSLARSAKAARLGNVRGVLFAAVFEQKIANKIRKEADSSIFKNIDFKGGLVYAKETRNELVARAVIETSNADGADQLHKLAAGAIAFFDVASEDPELAQLLDSLDIKSSGTKVTFTMKMPFATIKKLAPVLQGKMQGDGHGHGPGHGHR